ncbi:hypothetical protein [Aggregatibacter aphrophilus]|uniref:hypothetical protein n=1 Tax=Aggregatibacter aphrophilus TaxID=732 RepID=UPI0028E39A47|nr:hypothetical protein [Aggregatibacter aphrophilus]
MVIRRLFILLLFFPQFVFSEYYIKDNDIYNDGNKVKTILINDELGSVLLDNRDVLIISNSYNASSTKTELNYIFSKLNGNILKMEQVNYSPEYDRYYGYVLNFSNGINVENINERYMDSLESRYGFKDYVFFKKNSNLFINVKTYDKNLFFSAYDNKSILIINYDISSEGILLGEKYMRCEYLDERINSSSCKEIGFINKKSHLYTSPNGISKMYLIKGDQVIINDVRYLKNEKWYLINYKGKKEINMWIKADSVDLN